MKEVAANLSELASVQLLAQIDQPEDIYPTSLEMPDASPFFCCQYLVEIQFKTFNGPRNFTE
jgi:hypothetical protein